MLRLNAAASRGMIASSAPLAPAVLNGPVEQLKMSAVVGARERADAGEREPARR